MPGDATHGAAEFAVVVEFEFHVAVFGVIDFCGGLVRVVEAVVDGDADGVAVFFVAAVGAAAFDVDVAAGDFRVADFAEELQGVVMGADFADMQAELAEAFVARPFAGVDGVGGEGFLAGLTEFVGSGLVFRGLGGGPAGFFFNGCFALDEAGSGGGFSLGDEGGDVAVEGVGFGSDFGFAGFDEFGGEDVGVFGEFALGDGVAEVEFAGEVGAVKGEFAQLPLSAVLFGAESDGDDEFAAAFVPQGVDGGHGELGHAAELLLQVFREGFGLPIFVFDVFGRGSDLHEVVRFGAHGAVGRFVDELPLAVEFFGGEVFAVAVFFDGVGEFAVSVAAGVGGAGFDAAQFRDAVEVEDGGCPGGDGFGAEFCRGFGGGGRAAGGGVAFAGGGVGLFAPVVAAGVEKEGGCADNQGAADDEAVHGVVCVAAAVSRVLTQDILPCYRADVKGCCLPPGGAHTDKNPHHKSSEKRTCAVDWTKIRTIIRSWL